MPDTILLPCDGCGQLAPPAHTARRLQRLEWATRYRPVHIQTVLLGAIVPAQQGSYLYADTARFSGEAGQLLEALQLHPEAKSREDVLSEFQKRGLLLIHILECPMEGHLSPSEINGLLERQLPSTLARIRRSLKPKRVLLFSKELAAIASRLTEADFDAPFLLDNGKPFSLSEDSDSKRFAAFRQAMNGGFSLQK